MLSPPPNLPGRSVRVLLVDDDTELGELVREYLAREDFTLEVEADGTHAVDRALAGEHAIAVLIGQPPAAVNIGLAPLPATPPAIPVGVPSELLQRRSDVAAAERRVAAANAQIGVAVAAYYPTVTLSATAGFESGSIAKWFMWPSRFFSVGPTITETVFDGGLRGAQTAEARAAYDASIATYRQTVLGAFQDVEDNLAALRVLEVEAREQEEAAKAARRSLALTTNPSTAPAS